MLEPQEKLWDYPAVEAGQVGPPTVVTVTAEHIADYALVAQNPDRRFQRAGTSPEYDGKLVPMPTMVLTYAPLLREEIAERQGCVALEQSRTARRQTPFAKCEIRWLHPVFAGDTLTGTRRVLEKYERRGSRFVTFRVEAHNQHGDPVATYDYTCIFAYAGGQRAVPPARDTVSPIRHEAAAPMAGPGACRTFETWAVGDRLTPLTLSESQAVINRKNDLRLAGRPSPSNIHTDEEFARQNIFGGLVNAGPATMSYVDQMLEQSFPLRAFYHGGRLLMRAITPFRAGDAVTFAGEVTAKRVEEAKQLVECQVKGHNQRGELVCLADATLVLP